MKHRDLIKKLTDNGWWLFRQGARYEIYTNGKDIEPIPRHKEINERLTQAIIKKYDLK